MFEKSCRKMCRTPQNKAKSLPVCLLHIFFAFFSIQCFKVIVYTCIPLKTIANPVTHYVLGSDAHKVKGSVTN